MDANQLWAQVVKSLELLPHNQRNWFDPVRGVTFDGKVLTINAGSGCGAKFLQEHFIGRLREAVHETIPGATVTIVHKPMSLRG